MYLPPLVVFPALHAEQLHDLGVCFMESFLKFKMENSPEGELCGFKF